jgi:hypothetical protein
MANAGGMRRQKTGLGIARIPIGSSANRKLADLQLGLCKIANSLIESFFEPVEGFVGCGRITAHTEVTRCLSRSRRVVAGAFTVVAVVAMRFGFSAASGLSELAWHWRLPML